MVAPLASSRASSSLGLPDGVSGVIESSSQGGRSAMKSRKEGAKALKGAREPRKRGRLTGKSMNGSVVKEGKRSRSRRRGCGGSYREVKSGGLCKQGAIPERDRAQTGGGIPINDITEHKNPNLGAFVPYLIVQTVMTTAHKRHGFPNTSSTLDSWRGSPLLTGNFASPP